MYRLAFLIIPLAASLTLFAESDLEAKKDQVFDLIAQRLAYMEDVARYKVKNDLPIDDAKREEIVVENAKSSASEVGLNPTSIEGFFKAQIAAAKAIQYRARAQWIVKEAEIDEPTKDLDTEIRPALLILGEEIIDALKLYLELEIGFEDSLFSEFSKKVSNPHLSETHKRLLFKALQEVKLAEK